MSTDHDGGDDDDNSGSTARRILRMQIAVLGPLLANLERAVFSIDRLEPDDRDRVLAFIEDICRECGGALHDLARLLNDIRNRRPLPPVNHGNGT